MKHNVVWNSFLVTAASLVAAAISYIYNPFLIAPILGPKNIAVLGTFLFLTYALSFPQQPVSMTLIRFISHYAALHKPNKIAALIRHTLRRFTLYSVIATGFLLMVAPYLRNFLNLKTLLPILGAILLAYFGLVRSIVWTSLQGQLQFGRYSTVTILDPVFRLLLGGCLVVFGKNVWGAMLGYVGGYLASTLCALWSLRQTLFLPSQEALEHKAMRSFSIPAWIYSAYLAFAWSVDGLMVKHYFSDIEAGYYVAAATLAKMMFIIVTPIANVTFSMICNAISRKENTSSTLLKSLALTTGACAIFVSGYYLLAERVLNFTYGEQFLTAASFLPALTLAYVPFAVIYIYSGYFLASGRAFFAYGLVAGALAELAFMVLFHNTLFQIILCVGVGGLIQIGLSSLASFLPFRGRKQTPLLRPID